MAYSLSGNISASFPTGHDLSNSQYFFVAMDQTGSVGNCPAGTKAIGVLANQPSVGAAGQYAATVDLVGVTRICVAQVYAAGQVLVPGTDGTYVGIGMSAADASSTYNYARAITLVPSTKSLDIVPCLLLGPQAGIDSSATA